MKKRPNILMIMVDQMRAPCFDDGQEHGFHDPLKRIFGFQGSPDEDNEFERYLPGLWALRDNAVVLNNHRIASSACVPSRAAVFCGQYGTITGSLYTDGCLKAGGDPSYPWLDPEQFPTLGDWMRGAGYTTHYFGKWHLCDETTSDLEAYGFADWGLSYPDPYGGLPNNLGYYRDYQFSALARTFLLERGLGVPLSLALATERAQEAGVSKVASTPQEVAAVAKSISPWFAVCSFNNPHDIGLYAVMPRMVSDKSFDGTQYMLAVPDLEQPAKLPPTATMPIALNKLGFPQDNANLPATWDEDLAHNNKPHCHLEGAYKVGLALMSNAGQWTAQQARAQGVTDADELLKIASKATLDADQWGMPMALTSTPEQASLRYLQYYGYLVSEVDQHVHAVLNALEETGQADNTIVIFTADHGENGGSHGMMTQKFHVAYEETIRVPMVVRFPRAMLEVEGVMKQIEDVTSHIDILPTVLGLAGIEGEAREEIERALRGSHPMTRAPVGVDLSEFIAAQARGEDASIVDPQTQAQREGVLFTTHDTISRPLPGQQAVAGEGEEDLAKSVIFDAAVAELIRRARAGEPGTPPQAALLSEGPICDPSLINCVVSQDGWKLARYFSSMDELEQGNEYELYDLNVDPCELHNLLIFDGEFPTIIANIPEQQGLGAEQLAAKAREMMKLLTTLEGRMLEDQAPGT